MAPISFLGARGPKRAPTDRSGGASFDTLIGTVLASRFFIEAQLGRGSMGTVYRARHLRFGRAFAVKVPHRHLLASEAVVRRFEREAELAGRLQHRNIVTIVEGGQTDAGLRYLVMDYIDGPTLGDLIARGPLPAERVIRIARQLCDGLQHAHEAGLVHRDFKPDNVIVERAGRPDESPRIADFGIALLGDADEAAERVTTAGIVLGTPHYMAPEQSTGRPIDHRTDLFALGVICFELVTGRLPFDGDGVDVARANLLDDPPAMAVRAPGVAVDPLLEAFTRRLMAKLPRDRPASALHARALLDQIEADRGAAAIALGLVRPPAVLEAVERASRPLVAVARPSTVKAWPASSVPIPTAPAAAIAAPPRRRIELVLIAITLACLIAAIAILAC